MWCRIALWDCFGDAISFYWLLRGCAGNRFDICPPKQSHVTIRHNSDPVSRITAKWLIQKTAREGGKKGGREGREWPGDWKEWMGRREVGGGREEENRKGEGSREGEREVWKQLEEDEEMKRSEEEGRGRKEREEGRKREWNGKKQGNKERAYFFGWCHLSLKYVLYKKFFYGLLMY